MLGADNSSTYWLGSVVETHLLELGSPDSMSGLAFLFSSYEERMGLREGAEWQPCCDEPTLSLAQIPWWHPFTE